MTQLEPQLPPLEPPSGFELVIVRRVRVVLYLQRDGEWYFLNAFCDKNGIASRLVSRDTAELIGFWCDMERLAKNVRYRFDYVDLHSFDLHNGWTERGQALYNLIWECRYDYVTPTRQQ